MKKTIYLISVIIFIGLIVTTVNIYTKKSVLKNDVEKIKLEMEKNVAELRDLKGFKKQPSVRLGKVYEKFINQIIYLKKGYGIDVFYELVSTKKKATLENSIKESMFPGIRELNMKVVVVSKFQSRQYGQLLDMLTSAEKANDIQINRIEIENNTLTIDVSLYGV